MCEESARANTTSFTPATPLVSNVRTLNAGDKSGNQRSAKFPDPERLSDGKEPTFESWRDGITDRLRVNGDWFASSSEAESQRIIAGYIRARTTGAANDQISTFIRTLDNRNQPVTVDLVLGYLEKNFGNLHKRLDVRDAF